MNLSFEAPESHGALEEELHALTLVGAQPTGQLGNHLYIYIHISR